MAVFSPHRGPTYEAGFCDDHTPLATLLSIKNKIILEWYTGDGLN